MKKMTKKEMFAQILTHLTDVEEIAFIKHELELLENKKSSSTRKLTERQKENETFKDLIISFMQSFNTSSGFTIRDLQNSDIKLADLTNQRMSAILKQLTDEEVLRKEYIKRTVYFFLNEAN